MDEFYSYYARPIATCLSRRGASARDPVYTHYDDDKLLIESFSIRRRRGSAFQHRIKVLQRIFKRKYVRRALLACDIFTHLADDIVDNVVDFAVGKYPYVREYSEIGTFGERLFGTGISVRGYLAYLRRTSTAPVTRAELPPLLLPNGMRGGRPLGGPAPYYVRRAWSDE